LVARLPAAPIIWFINESFFGSFIGLRGDAHVVVLREFLAVEHVWPGEAVSLHPALTPQTYLHAQ